eukprot:scaffold712_cov60-Phaeocystis_antarctica.AAC.2
MPSLLSRAPAGGYRPLERHRDTGTRLVPRDTLTSKGPDRPPPPRAPPENGDAEMEPQLSNCGWMEQLGGCATQLLRHLSAHG